MGPEAVFWTFVLGLIYVAEAGTIGDQCDWTGSGLTSSAERGVTPVYLRCREGGVSWLYPRGALRLLFKPPLPADERDFTVCIRVIRRPDPPDLFHTLRQNETVAADRFPARIFVEGVRRLVPLYAPDDGDVRELRCFHSRNGQAALYVEAEPEDGPKRRVATFKYEARPLVRRHYDPATADCRPCSDSELELAFCTSDLVSRGIIIGSELHEEMDATRLTWHLTKLLRVTAPGTGGETIDIANTSDIADIANDVDDNYYRSGRARRALRAHVHVSAACGAEAGAGEFLLMARRRLGRYALACAPRLRDWRALVRRRAADGSAHCQLHY
ncbi:meteorin-like protein [Melitaea cinxia]|uniref:meteorin-like protein n=1 Tax=Melitaea cinxia TaxID=113334 RepID=UPI001E272A75|nr:meteorin-like protein [Melitaea cinxia]